MSNSACLNGGGHFVFDYLHPGTVADHFLTVLERLDTPHIQPHR
jgi:hypothetical protein